MKVSLSTGLTAVHIENENCDPVHSMLIYIPHTLLYIEIYCNAATLGGAYDGRRRGERKA